MINAKTMKVFEKQLWHLIALVVLIFGLATISNSDNQILVGSLWNINTKTWFLVAILIPIIHQVYVLVIWRSELYYNKITKIFGKRAFKLYKAIFFIFFIGRMVFLIILAIANEDTFYLNIYALYILIITFSIVAFYAFYSVLRFFGTDRAAGLDHFDLEARKLSLVKKGIFKYTNNGMYKYAFLAFYLPGLIWQSKAALLVAIFSHIYIWVHYYVTEKPDMNHIYQNN